MNAHRENVAKKRRRLLNEFIKTKFELSIIFIINYHHGVIPAYTKQ